MSVGPQTLRLHLLYFAVILEHSPNAIDTESEVERLFVYRCDVRSVNSDL
jgi:hypothetical protein